MALGRNGTKRGQAAQPCLAYKPLNKKPLETYDYVGGKASCKTVHAAGYHLCQERRLTSQSTFCMGADGLVTRVSLRKEQRGGGIDLSFIVSD